MSAIKFLYVKLSGTEF